MPLADLLTATQVDKAYAVANDSATCACGLAFGVSSFNRKSDVDYWSKYATELKAAHQRHHSLHFGVKASLQLTVNDKTITVLCSDEVVNGP